MMTKEYWTKRKAGWDYYNKWEKERLKMEYRDMPYSKRFEIFETLYALACERNSRLVNPQMSIEKLVSHPNYKFRVELVKRKQRLPKVNFQ